MRKGLITLITVSLASCGTPTPTARNVNWQVTPTDGNRAYEVSFSGNFTPENKGYIRPELVLVDERGCNQRWTLEPELLTTNGHIEAVQTVNLARKVFSATLTLSHVAGGQPDSEVTRIYRRSTIINADLKPEPSIKQPCADTPAEAQAKERQERTNRKQQAASHGGYGSAALRERGELIATVLNLNGLLCARVVAVEPLKVSSDAFEVTCVEYRGGTGTVSYIVNAADGTAFRP